MYYVGKILSCSCVSFIDVLVFCEKQVIGAISIFGATSDILASLTIGKTNVVETISESIATPVSLQARSFSINDYFA